MKEALHRRDHMMEILMDADGEFELWMKHAWRR